jgi:DNA-directed RNA polymerase alpha subunit
VTSILGGKMVKINPTPDLLNDTPIADLDLPTRIKNALERNGLETVRDIRETSDRNFLSFQDMGPRSLKFLRSALGGVQARD